MRRTDIEREVAWGESHEEPILLRWVALSRFARGAKFWHPGERFFDWDWAVYDKRGLPLCLLEVKRRTGPLGRYGDAMFPRRKHDFARLARAVGFQTLAVTEYACGSLVEVNLDQAPAKARDVARRDRPGMKPVPHVFYEAGQLTVLARGIEAP